MPIIDRNSSDENDNTVIVIEDGQDLNGLRAKVEAKAGGENAVHVIADINDDNSGSGFIPPFFSEHHSMSLMNNGSKDMSVNGSSTPVEFDYAPSAGQVVYLYELNVFLNDNGNNNPESFGSISALSNGVEVITKVNGTEYTFATLNDNIDMGTVFNGVPVKNNSEEFAGFWGVNPYIKLDGDQGDFIRFKIQDNLNSLNHFRARVKVWSVL